MVARTGRAWRTPTARIQSGGAGGETRSASQIAARSCGAIGVARWAAPGDTIIVGPGTYREHLRIDKPPRLIGQGRPVIDGGGSGDIVEITAPGVEFRGFLVRDTGRGRVGFNRGRLLQGRNFLSAGPHARPRGEARDSTKTPVTRRAGGNRKL